MNIINQDMKAKELVLDLKKIKKNKPLWKLCTEIVIGGMISLSTLFLFLKITEEVFEPQLFRYDEIISKYIYSLRTPLLNNIMIIITNFGWSILVLLAVALFMFLFTSKNYQEAVIFALILILSIFLNIILKDIAVRPRPTISPLINENTYSFPSGHAMNSMVFYGFAAYLVFHFSRHKKISLLLGSFLFLLVLLIGFSRVYLGVHYPSDVIAGFVIGAWWLITAISLEKSLELLQLFFKRKQL